MATVVNSFSIVGIEGYLVKIEIDTIYGQPSVSIVGIGDTAIKEARERVEATIINSKFEFPKMKIVINLSPSDVKKRGSHFDLGMAIALLATKTVPVFVRCMPPYRDWKITDKLCC